MEKEKTAMQQLIERINTADSLRSLVSWVSQNKEAILEKDRQQIEDANYSAYPAEDRVSGKAKQWASDYFTQKYGQ